METKAVKRSKLTDVLKAQKETLKKDVFFITSVRATANGSIQVEVCQNRQLAGRNVTLLGILNRSDDRFRPETTMLFDWLTFKPADFIKAFPGVKVTLAQLEDIAKQWDENAPAGKEALVYPILAAVEKVVDASNGVSLTPVITVTEVTETQLRNKEFFKGPKADERIANVLDNNSGIMRTGSSDEDEDLVDPSTGDKIFRFTQVEFKESVPAPQDKLIVGKMTRSEFDKRSAGSNKETSMEDLKSMLNQPTSI